MSVGPVTLPPGRARFVIARAAGASEACTIGMVEVSALNAAARRMAHDDDDVGFGAPPRRRSWETLRMPEGGPTFHHEIWPSDPAPVHEVLARGAAVAAVSSAAGSPTHPIRRTFLAGCAWAASGAARRPAAASQKRPPLHYSITSSARASTAGGIVRPSAFAALRLMTSSNWSARSTGRSEGLAPFRILST